MKKVLMSAAFIFIAVLAINAQETKTKPVTTPTDKVHNVTHPHHKVSHGTKTKHETAAGTKHVTTEKTPQKEALKPKEKTEEKPKH
jgi:hypothetical protein